MEIIDKNRIGDISEHKAILWLWDQGYEVFKNCGCTGKVDLIAVKDGEILQIDVKTVQIRDGDLSFRAYKHEEQLARGVKFLWVYENQVGWNRDYFTYTYSN